MKKKAGKTKRERLARVFEKALVAGEISRVQVTEISFMHVEKIAIIPVGKMKMRTVGRITKRGNLRVNPAEKVAEKP